MTLRTSLPLSAPASISIPSSAHTSATAPALPPIRRAPFLSALRVGLVCAVDVMIVATVVDAPCGVDVGLGSGGPVVYART